MELRTSQIKGVIVHCSASDVYADDCICAVDYLHTSSKHQNVSWNDEIIKGKGWDDVGYNVFIQFNGTIELGRDIKYKGAHAYGYNNTHLSVCLAGLDEVGTAKQLKSLEFILRGWVARYHLKWSDVIGHNEVNPNKSCPVFDFKKFKKDVLEIPEQLL